MTELTRCSDCRRGSLPSRRLQLEILESRCLLATMDAYEVDDTPEQAKDLVVNAVAQTRSIHRGGSDVDWIRFALESSADVEILVDLPTGFPQVFGRPAVPNMSLFAEGNTQTPISSPCGTMLRSHALEPGTYFIRVDSPQSGLELDSYTISVHTSGPVDPIARSNWVQLAGNGFNSIAFTPTGQQSQLLWMGGDLTYRVRQEDGSFSEEVVLQGSLSRGCFDPRDYEKAQLIHTPQGETYALIVRDDFFVSDDASIDIFHRDEAGWNPFASTAIPISNSESIFNMSAAAGPDGSLHVALVSQIPGFGILGGQLIYGHNRSGQWKFEHAAEPASEEEGEPHYFTRRRYLSLAIDSKNHAHIAYTPLHLDFGENGFSRRFSQLAYATNRYGAWQSQVIHEPADDSGESGVGYSIAIGPDDEPAIAQFYVERVSTGSASGSRLLFHQHRPGSGWNSEVVVESPDGYVAGDGAMYTGFAPQLQFDALGNPHIVFSDHASQHFPSVGAREYAGQIRHAVRIKSDWEITTIIRQSDPLRNNMTYPSMAIFSNEIFFVGIRGAYSVYPNGAPRTGDHYFVSASLPRTGLTVKPERSVLNEDESIGVRVTRHHGNTNQELVVTLGISEPGQVLWPRTAIIPAGKTETVVQLSGIIDQEKEDRQILRLTASAQGYVPGSNLLFLEDVSTAVLRGQVLNDTDGNGVLSGTESGLAGRIIFLDKNLNGQIDGTELTTTSSHDGTFEFEAIEPGDYRLMIQLAEGWVASSPSAGYFPVTLGSGDVHQGFSFAQLSLGFSADTGTLVLQAADAEDLSLSASNGEVVLVRNGSADAAFNAVASDQVKAIIVYGGNGDNVIDLRQVSNDDFSRLQSVIVRDRAGHDELFGSRLDDVLDATFGDPQLHPGEDRLDGGPGSDHLIATGASQLFGGPGDDLLSVHNDQFVRIDGADGFDVVDILGEWLFELSTVEEQRLTGIEKIDLSSPGGAVLKFSATDVARLFADGTVYVWGAADDDLVCRAAGWQLSEPEFQNGIYHRVLTNLPGQPAARALLAGPNPWRNPLLAADVNADGIVTPLDSLLVINWLNAKGAVALRAPATIQVYPEHYVDVNGDDFASAIDVLLIINLLNSIT